MRSRVALLRGAGEPPELTNRETSAPGPDEALIRVSACGLCGSDLFLQEGGFGTHVFPVVPGHEASGVVEEIGPATDGLRSQSLSVGDQVALYYIDNDPHSRWVQEGHPHLGPGVKRMGVDCDGALADFVVRPIRTLIRPPSPIPLEALAVLTDAVSTPYHALTSVAGVERGDRVVVLGIGGVGSNAVQLAHVLGATVIAVGRSAYSRALASRLGATAVLEAGTNLGRDLAQLLPAGADVVLVCSDAPGLVRTAVEHCAPRGRVVLVAATRNVLDVTCVDLIWREIRVLGSRGFTPDDIRDVQGLYLDGLVNVDHLLTDVRPLAGVASAFNDLKSGGSTRIVIVP